MPNDSDLWKSELLTETNGETVRQGWQVSVGQLFWLTSASALCAMVYQTVGAYWCWLVLAGVVCMIWPAYDGLNPILQAVGYAAVMLALTFSLAYAFRVAPMAAIVPCCLLPSLAYVVGFSKGLQLLQ